MNFPTEQLFEAFFLLATSCGQQDRMSHWGRRTLFREEWTGRDHNSRSREDGKRWDQNSRPKRDRIFPHGQKTDSGIPGQCSDKNRYGVNELLVYRPAQIRSSNWRRQAHTSPWPKCMPMHLELSTFPHSLHLHLSNYLIMAENILEIKANIPCNSGDKRIALFPPQNGRWKLVPFARPLVNLISETHPHSASVLDYLTGKNCSTPRNSRMNHPETCVLGIHEPHKHITHPASQ